MTTQTDVKVEFIGDVLEASPDYIASSQTPPAGGEPFILDNTEFSDGTTRILTFTTSSAQAGTVRLGLTFLDAAGITRNYFGTLPATPGTSIFDQTGIYCMEVLEVFILQGTPTTDISIGMSGMGSIYKPVAKGSRIRLKGYSICSTAVPGDIVFSSGPSTTSPVSFKARTAQNISLDYTIPGEGILYPNGLYVSYDLANAKMMNLFYG